MAQERTVLYEGSEIRYVLEEKPVKFLKYRVGFRNDLAKDDLALFIQISCHHSLLFCKVIGIFGTKIQIDPVRGNFFSEIRYVLEEKPVKNLNLRIHKDCKVYVSANPHRVSMFRIRSIGIDIPYF